jgi:hypothetical protein
VRLGVCASSLPHVGVGRQFGYSPLHDAASYSHHSAAKWITDRVPYQVLERRNDGTCHGGVVHP